MGPTADRWYVTVPDTFESLAEQTCRAAIIGAARQGGHRRIIVEACTPELDPASGKCRLPELTRFAREFLIQSRDSSGHL